MAGLDPNIPLAQRYELLVKQWMSFGQTPDARVCRWLIEADELQMIEQFVNIEASFQGRTPELFFKFTTPFINQIEYGQLLIEELLLQAKNYRELFPDSGFELKWGPLAKSRKQNDPQYFLDSFASFGNSLEFSNPLVAYLYPPEIKSFPSWKKWMAQLVKAGIPESLRIMLVEVETGSSSPMEELAAQFPNIVVTIRPELDMTGAMKEVASAGDPNHPGVQFQLAFIDLSQAAAKGKMKRMQQLAGQCLDITRQKDWPHLQVAVFFAMGAAWMGKKNYAKVLEAYDQACLVAENMFLTRKDAGQQLYIQTLFARASVFVSPDKKIRNFEKAYSDYEKAAGVAEKLPEKDPAKPYHSMEAWRMMGYCQEELKDYQNAESCYHRSLKAGKEMKAEERSNSTLPYTGAALIRINPKIGKYDKELAVRHQMIELVGEDWETKVITKKNGPL